MPKLLMLGVAEALTQNIEYAMPARLCAVYYTGTAPTYSTVTGGTFATTANPIAANFIKSSGTDTVVVAKAY